mmetsp:Transcript_23609/g.40609  ORF Transcript_23609/g.40609 Transcript_23609/m.40609 type:complete len:185 (-) Transcript_23609:339-893(-)
MSFLIAAVAILFHVVNYNFTAQLEHKTRVFTKVIGKRAVYYYAVFLVLCALYRDHLIDVAIKSSSFSIGLLPSVLGALIGYLLVGVGLGLNLWTLKVLGIKGMYNGDSFGFLFDAPVTSGPYQWLSDPQYVGTTMAAVGYAIANDSLDGIVLAVWMGVVFFVSVRFVEGPHMARIYRQSKKRTV